MKEEIRLQTLPDGAVMDVPVLWNRKAAGTLGLDDLELSVRKMDATGMQCRVQLSGRFAGQVDRPLLLVVQVYNQEHEMIGTDFNLSISEEDGLEDAECAEAWQDYPFERILELPVYEQVSQIAVSVIPDPAFEGLRDVLNDLTVIEEEPEVLSSGEPQKPEAKNFAEDWEERWAEWIWLEDHGKL